MTVGVCRRIHSLGETSRALCTCMIGNGHYNATRAKGTFAALALSLPLVIVAPAASAAGIATSPPPKFKKVSTLVKLPDFLPGLGTLYVDPATLPIGPFLGYDHKGKLVNITYMREHTELYHTLQSDVDAAEPVTRSRRSKARGQ